LAKPYLTIAVSARKYGRFLYIFKIEYCTKGCILRFSAKYNEYFLYVLGDSLFFFQGLVQSIFNNV